MELVADILLVAGALGAGFYCFVLARRLNRFNDLEKGVGGAVAVLSAQVDDLGKTLTAARSASNESTSSLEDLTARAEAVAQRLELLMASLHDLPDEAPAPKPPSASNPPQKPAADRPASGPMFVRHGRAQDEAVQ
ncbi:hypothetical protein LCL97_06805 [Seohaeicola saemankumensis]|nr:hypothetical protein [Seohaeicola saemankumensis]MCA0870526.1 hypothetical protein [Seohaeicola saemankumensis]